MSKHKHTAGERIFIVYDSRAASGDTDDAGILETLSAPSNRKAKQEARSTWGDQPYVLYGCTFNENGEAVQDEAPLVKHWC